MNFTTGRGGNLLLIKEQNRTLVREVIYKFSPISRIQIAQALSLTPSTITTNVNELIDGGLLRECHEDQNADKKALGRHPVCLEFIPDSRYVIGMDIGPYYTTFILADLRGNIHTVLKEDALYLPYRQLVPYAAEKIQLLIKKSSVASKLILGTGIGIPASVDEKAGIIRESSRMDWSGMAFARDLASKIHMSVAINNNVMARIAAADLFNRNLEADIFLYYYASEGLSCPMVVRTNMLGSRIIGGSEIGYMVVEKGNGRKADKKHLVAAASGKVIRQQCFQALKNGTAPILSRICANPDQLKMEEILEAQKSGDRAVTAVIQKVIGYLGMNLANLINFIHPQGVLIESFIMTLPQNRKLLLETLKEYSVNPETNGPVIEFVPYSIHCGALGGAALVIRKFLLLED
jgi:predicted NBD/HSP70 family sugar kinase